MSAGCVVWGPSPSPRPQPGSPNSTPQPGPLCPDGAGPQSTDTDKAAAGTEPRGGVRILSARAVGQGRGQESRQREGRKVGGLAGAEVLGGPSWPWPKLGSQGGKGSEG